MDNEEIIAAVSDELGISYDTAEKFLNDGCGAYARIDGEDIWVSGQLIARLLNAVT